MADRPINMSQAPDMDRAPVMIWMSGLKNERIYFNKAWLNFTGRSLELESGQGWADSIHRDDFNACLDELESALDQRVEFKLEYRLKRHDGQFRWIVDHGLPLLSAEGAFEGFIGSCFDITERRETEHELMEARELAEEHGRMKDEFLATISKELRLPLTPILGWTRLYKNGKVTAEQIPHAMDVIERNASIQATLLEDLLDVSRIIAGRIRLEMKPVGLAQIIEAAIDTVRHTADEKSIQIVFTMESSVGPISGDPVRLQQIVWNLLNNALKFSPKNSRVEVRLSRTNSQAQIAVTDMGAGIEADRLPFLFNRYSPASPGGSRWHGGLGLGLPIVRHLAELHGGSVSASSEGAGKGARFVVRLPIPSVRPDVQNDPPAYPFGAVATRDQTVSLQNVKVLVVDDEADSRELICFALKEWGAEVLPADSVRDAIEKFSSFKPDIVVSDIGMPGEDGYVLIRKLRELDKEIPAIALTAYARSEDRARVISSGFQQHVTKPVEPLELATAVARLVKRTA